MNLEQYKAQVEAQRKDSMLKAIATLTNANAVLESTFNLKEDN
jgi:hypothetical protein